MQPHPFPLDSQCLAARYLSSELYRKLRQKSTRSGFTIRQALRSGLENSDSDIGIYAGDEESYAIFTEILAPIIEHYHGVRPATHHKSDTSVPDLPPLDPHGNHILSSRIRVARNVKGFAFNNHISLKQRLQLEETITPVLEGLGDNFVGRYHAYPDLDRKTTLALAKVKALFPRGDRFQQSGGFNRDFPLGRGVFINSDGCLRIWVGEEDHLRIIYQAPTADLAHVFQHHCEVVSQLSSQLALVQHRQYGFLTSCPSNIGTAMRAGVHIKLDTLGKNIDRLQAIARAHDLQIRGTAGEKTTVRDNVFDISYAKRFGVSEKEIICNLHRGLSEILSAETNSRSS